MCGYKLFFINEKQLNIKTYSDDTFIGLYYIQNENNKYCLYNISKIVFNTFNNNLLYIKPEFIKELGDDAILINQKYFILNTFDDIDSLISLLGDKNFKILFKNKYKCNITKICFPSAINQHTIDLFKQCIISDVQKLNDKNPWFKNIDYWLFIIAFLTLFFTILSYIKYI